MILTDEEIEDMKELLADKEIFEDDEIENWKKVRIKISTESISLARLFVFCHDTFVNNPFLFEKKENLEKIKVIIPNYDLIELRRLLEDYGGGGEFGDYYLVENIKKIVAKNRKNMLGLIVLFFAVFGEES